MLSVIGAAMTVVNQTLIRKKLWLGWVLGIPNTLLFMYLQWRTGNYGYAFLLGPFWLVNACLAIQEWRRTLALVLTQATVAMAGGPRPIVESVALVSGTSAGLLTLLVGLHVALRRWRGRS
jgi:hypothetical protein